MPELLEFQEVIESHPVVLAIVCASVALLAAVLTRWVDQASLDSAHERLTAYEEEVRLLNEVRADLLSRLEGRGDEVRRTKAELARRESAAKSRAPRPEVAGPVAAPVAGGASGRPDAVPALDPDWRRR